jgi:hypothetical protein
VSSTFGDRITMASCTTFGAHYDYPRYFVFDGIFREKREIIIYHRI